MGRSNCRLARMLFAAVDKMAKVREVKATADLLQVIKSVIQRCRQRVCPSSGHGRRGKRLASDNNRRTSGKEPFRWGHISGLQVGGRHCACWQDDPMAAVMHSDSWSRRSSHGLPDGSPRNGQPAAGGRAHVHLTLGLSEGAQGSPKNGQPAEGGQALTVHGTLACQGRKRREAPKMDNPGAIHTSYEQR